MKRTPFLILVFILFIFACQDELLEESEFPVFKTLEVTDIDATGATFNGEWIATGKKSIKSYGFVWKVSMWGEPLLPADYDTFSPPTFVQFDGDPDSSYFNCRINRGLEEGNDYQLRAFAISYNNTVVYANIVYFVSEGSTYEKYQYGKNHK
jgi:hypothetical protein